MCGVHGAQKTIGVFYSDKACSANILNFEYVRVHVMYRVGEPGGIRVFVFLCLRHGNM